ncbi:PspC domain-containing protein [Microbacterium sp. X-17]|uniref:PspC domain-containing protein n=1 Tax=Microbacterium sp. X-17 TaxID=3144404 RepID=UPI0031F51783
MNSLTRPRQGRLVAGVIAGIAQRFGVDPIPVRILFVASLLLFGLSLWVYLLLWILIPAES